MAELIDAPVVFETTGDPPKRIEEFVGRIATATSAVSIARMTSPPGWGEVGQTPEFDEILLVLEGCLCLETRRGTLEARAGQALRAFAGEWMRCSTREGAVYVAICLPAFSPTTARRDA
ncbi:MAG: cupin [Holophagales bacterium]|nr:MAG: cupin [Holophagales bacterium]